MRTKDFIEGLGILQPYYDNPYDCNLCAEHDVIYIYSTDTPVPEPLVKRLCELGFFQEDVELGEDEDFGPKHYDPEEGWAVYV